MTELTYHVPAMSCDHCERAVRDEVGSVAGVESLAVDLKAKRVVVAGETLDDAAIRSAIEEAGYEAL